MKDNARFIPFIFVIFLISTYPVYGESSPGSSTSTGASSSTATTPESNDATPKEVISKAELLYQKALEIRDAPNPPENSLKKAVDMLYTAAGIESISIEKPSISQSRTQMPGDGDSTGSKTRNSTLPLQFIDASSVTVTWRNGTYQHAKSVRELIFIFREGDGAPLNPAIAHKLLQILAAGGDPNAQAELAFYLATGVNPVAPNALDQIFQLVAPDVPAALVYYYFAAKEGDPIAQMTMGYRHYHGVDVPQSCQTAALYYVPVVEKVLEMARVQDGLPSQRPLRLSYKAVHSRPKPNADQELLHYKWFADYGHADAARTIAHLLSHGDIRDYDEALKYLRQAANGGDAGAMAHLGHMYANGIAVEQNNVTAWSWFWKSAERGNPSGFFGLGYMTLTGQGAEVDHKIAFNYFKQSIEVGQDWPGIQDSFFYLGTMHMKGMGTPVDANQGISYLNMASRSGNLLAAYNLAVLHLREKAGEKGSKACKTAVSHLQRVAERGWPALTEATDDFSNGEYGWALLNFLKAGEWGSELGQSNAGWMLLEHYGYQGPRAGELAVTMLKRAAEQGNTGALVRIGDSYWYGKGVARDWAKAGRMYAEAARYRVAQALFNLGYMHQFGVGVAKDFPLAKRYYDKSAEAAPDAWLATSMALASLKVQQWWVKVEPSVPRRWAQLLNEAFIVREPPSVDVGGDRNAGGDFGDAQQHRGLDGGAPSSAPQQQHRHYHHHHHQRRGLIARVQRMLSVAGLVDILDMIDDSFDIMVVMWLAAALVLVLWRRQVVRARQAGAGVDAGAAAGVGGATPPLVEPHQQEGGRGEERREEGGGEEAVQPQVRPATDEPSRPQEVEEEEVEVQQDAVIDTTDE